jgi:hypothetical protein
MSRRTLAESSRWWPADLNPHSAAHLNAVSKELVLRGVVLDESERRSPISWRSLLSEVIFVTVALIWLIPDRRIEHVLPRNET